MQKLIIVCGLPGSGKTLLANEVSKKTGIVCLSKDMIKEKLYEGLNLSTFEDSKKIGKPSIDIMLHIAEQQLINGIDIIIEAPFNFSEDYLIFEEWKNKYNIELYSVICHIDTKERKRRFDERFRHRAHHDNMRISSFFPKNEYDYAAIPGNQIRIKTNESVAKLAEKVILQLK